METKAAAMESNLPDKIDPNHIEETLKFVESKEMRAHLYEAI